MKLLVESDGNTYNMEYSGKTAHGTARCFDFDRMVDMINIILKHHEKNIARETLRVEGYFE